MARKTTDDIKKLLTTASQFWVCPLTNKRFNSGDEKAISEHKNQLIAAAEKADAAEDRKKKIKAHVSKLAKVASFNDFKNWFLADMQLKMGDDTLTMSDLPTFSVVKTPFKHAHAISSYEYYYQERLLVVGGPKGKMADFRKKMGIVTAHIAGDESGVAKHLYIIPKSPFRARYIELNDCTRRHKKKLTEEQSATLRKSNKKYRDNVEVIKKLSEQISELRKRANVLILENEQARYEVLNNEDSVLSII